MDFDYVIVGAGSAGCLLANRLSRDPATRVLLLEAGGRDDYFWISIPVGYLYTIANPRTDWCYKTEPDEHLAGRSIHYARGRVLGGCSSINAMIHMRGQKEDWDYWASLGNRGWAWDDVLPLFRSLEDYEGGAVDGYVLGAGRFVTLNAPVENDVWLAAERVTVNDDVGSNAMVAGRIVHMSEGATVGENARLAGNQVRSEAHVRRDLSITAQTAEIGGEIDGEVRATARDVRVLPGAVDRSHRNEKFWTCGEQPPRYHS